MTVDGNEIPAQAYFYWTAYNCSYFEYQLGMLAAYGMSGDLVNVEDGSVNWDAPFSEDQTLSQYVKEETKSAVTFYAVAENLAAELGVTLTEEDENGHCRQPGLHGGGAGRRGCLRPIPGGAGSG